MDDALDTAAGLPIFLLLPVMIGFVAILLPVLQKTQSSATRFLLFALWTRFFLSALHTITFKSSPFGMSWNALASVGITGLGCLVIRRRPIIGLLLPIIVFLFVILASGIASRDISGIVEVFVKYGYFIVIVLAMFDALEDIGVAELCNTLIFTMIIPLTLQVLSVLFHISKGTEDGSGISYIGGFSHESSFSMILICGLFLLGFSNWKILPKSFLFMLLILGILLANYRTAILSIVPLIVVLLFTGIIRRTIPSQRKVVALGLLFLGAIGSIGVGWLGSNRFADLAVVAREGTGIIKPPETFTTEDRHLFSGRTLIWSQYIYGYKEGSVMQKAIGHGPESWQTAFKIYAHNTLISTLYEYGIVGVGVVLMIWLWMFVIASQADVFIRSRLMSSHISYIILAMATMPMWQIEGLLLYAIICGLSVFSFRTRVLSVPDKDRSRLRS